MDIIIYAVGGLLFLVVCFGIYQIRRRWSAWHLVFTGLLFVLSIVFVVMAAVSLKTRSSWLKQYADLTGQVANSDAEYTKLLYGDLTEIRQTEASVRRIRAQLNRTMADRGRVWRECAPQEITADAVTLSTLRPGMEAAQAPPNGIAVKDVLYAFKELNKDGQLAPAIYLGEFSVVDRTDQSVKLRPIVPLDPVQAANIQAPGNWSLYEIIPVDSHRAFADDPDAQASLEQDEPLFGTWDAERLKAYFSEPVSLYLSGMGNLLNPQIFENLLQQQYMRDGYVLSEEEVRTGGDDLAANTWIKLRFLKAWKVPVDELNGNAQSALNGGYFDATGRAVVDFLRRPEGQDVEFKADDLAVFDAAKARELISQGIAEQVAPYLVRPLVDFDRAFHFHHVRSSQLDNDVADIQRNLAALQDSKKKSEAQIAFRQQERAKLLQDRDLFFREREAVGSYQTTLTDEVQQLRQEMNALVRQNAELAAELTRLQAPTGVAINP